MEKKREAVYNPEADKRWAEKNKEHKNYLSNRSAARSFIRNKATMEDLEELKDLIKEKEGDLKMENKMELMKELVEKHLDTVEKETGREFSREKRNEVIKNCQDTLGDDEVKMADEEFTGLINGWLEDGKENLLAE